MSARLSHTARHFAFFVMAMILFCVISAPARALTVDNIRFGTHPDKTRMVLELSEKVDFRVFTLSNPWRLVIDMPAFGWDVSAVSTPVQSGVSSIRQGPLQPGISRIVIDMDKPADIKAVFFMPRDGNLPDRLVVDFNTVSTDTYNQQQRKVYGRLVINDENATDTKSRLVASVKESALLQAGIPASKPAATPAVSPGSLIIPQKKPPELSFEKPLIIIDAGHGGVDPGAVGAHGLNEKNITLSMAKELKRQLENSGRYRVMMTRDRDAYLRLYQRIDFARRNKGDLFISLHADSIDKKGVHGASVYTLSENASDAQTERLAMRENRADLIAGVDLSAEDEVVVNILVDLTMRDTMNQSKFFANTVVDILDHNGIDILDNPHRYAGFAVLKAPDIPSILIEMGFMSNGAESKMLANPGFQQKMARALMDSLDIYFDRVRRNGRT